MNTLSENLVQITGDARIAKYIESFGLKIINQNDIFYTHHTEAYRASLLVNRYLLEHAQAPQKVYDFTRSYEITTAYKK